MLTFYLLRFASIALIFGFVWALDPLTELAVKAYRSLRSGFGSKAARHSFNQGRA